MKINYCVECGKQIQKETETDYKCPDGHFFYNNPSPAVSVVPIKDGKMLLSVRGIEPAKGKIDTIGGFLDHFETAEQAVHRETKEETGLEVKILDRLSSMNVRYEDYNRALGLFFAVEIVGGTEAPADDVAELVWYPIDEPPSENLSWPRMIDAFKELQDWRKNHKQ